MAKANSQRLRKLSIESLEPRRVLASLPFGADPVDTGEFMLGRIAVTPVLLESNGAIDQNTENWTPAAINRVMANIEEGLQWWTDLLATKSSVHTLDWIIDRTFVDNPASTPYEPISRTSNAFNLWVPHFLTSAGFGDTPSIEANVRNFNNEQRLKHDADWAFIIFVVNSENDSDGNFAAGGSFSRAFAFAGGLFQVIPSTRPASTYAHETGHMFWARDEYSGGGSYNQYRGYYNAQNTNAIDANPNVGFVQEPSIMSSGITLDLAWHNLVTSDATLAQLGWRDSDGDGIFDVLDVPLKLDGTGRLDSSGTFYEFKGSASAQAYPNLNSFGTQNDITLNKVDRVEYRIDNGTWTTISTPGTATAELTLRIPVSASNTQIEIRAVDAATGIVSNLFSAELNDAPERTISQGIYGYAWLDDDDDGQWNLSERTLSGTLVSLTDEQGTPLNLQTRISTSNLPVGYVSNPIQGVSLDAVGVGTDGRIAVIHPTNGAAAYFRSYNLNGQPLDTFAGDNNQLRARFVTPQSEVSIDAIAPSPNTHVRLEAYDASGNLLQRTERKGLANGQRVTLTVGSAAGNIAYVIARSFNSSHSQFDNLVFGNTTTTRTNSDGSFSFPYLPAGSYRVQVSPSNLNHQPAAGTSFRQLVQLTSTAEPVRADFAIYAAPSPWRNPIQSNDVDKDGFVGPLDALILVNEINRDGTRALTTEDLSSTLFLDPNGDSYISPLDVLQVINYINSHGVANGEPDIHHAPSETIETNEPESEFGEPSPALSSEIAIPPVVHSKALNEVLEDESIDWLPIDAPAVASTEAVTEFYPIEPVSGDTTDGIEPVPHEQEQNTETPAEDVLTPRWSIRHFLLASRIKR